MENETPAQDPAPETPDPSKGFQKRKKEKPAPPAEKPKKVITPPKPSITAQKWPALLEAINSGNVDAVRKLIAEGVIVNTIRDGFSPLMIAATASQVEIARLFLEKGVNVNDTDDDGNTAFHRAAAYQSGSAIVELLLASGIDVNAKNRFKKTALMLAEELGHKDIVRAIRTHLDRAKIDEQEWLAFLNTPEGEPYKRRRQLDLLNRYMAFIWAPPVGLGFAGLVIGALMGAAALTFFIGLLLGAGVIGAVVYQMRILNAYFDSREPLPELDIHILRAKRKAHEPLPVVRKRDLTELPPAVLEEQPVPAASASPITVPASARPAPYTAAVAPEPEDTEVLDAVIVTEERETAPAAPVELAAPELAEPEAPVLASPPATAPSISAPEPVAKAPVMPPAPPRTAPVSHAHARPPAASSAKTERPRTTTASPARSFELPDKRMMIIVGAGLLVVALLVTALIFRHNLEHWYYAKQLRSRGFDTSAQAVLSAAEKNDLESVDLLLKAGASLDAVDGGDRTALMLAAEKGHADMIAKLLNADGALLDRVDKSGHTALMTASRQGQEKAVAALVERGSNVNFIASVPKGPVAALMAALSAPDFTEAHMRVLRYLLDKGADVKARDASGHTALFYAAERGSEQAAALLLDHGAEVNAIDQGGDFPLLIASCRGYTGIARMLLDRGADVRQASGGQTSFLCAVEEGRLDTMKLLIERGADVNSQTAGGVTVLTIASGMGNLAAVTLLLEKGADPATGYLPAPFLSLAGRKISVWAVNSRISGVLHQVAKAASRDGYAVTMDSVAERKVTLKTKDSWNKVLHKLAVNNNLLLLVKDKEIVVLSYDPAVVKKAPQ